MVKNESLTFLLPFLSTKKYNRTFFINKYFIGTFIGDINRYHYDHEILLVYKKIREIPFYEFEVILMNHPWFTKISYDYLESDLVVYVFKIPSSLEEDFENVLKGYYSGVDQKLKQIITEFWNTQLRKETSKSYSVFYEPSNLDKYWNKQKIKKEDVCFKGEVWTAPLFEQELFNADLF